jgi:hypothetical protein
MGHERIGYLPKTKKWNAIVEDIGSFSSSNDNISQIAQSTTKNVRTRFNRIVDDEGVIAAVKYILLIAHSAKLKNPFEFLLKHNINLPNNFNIFELSLSIQNYIAENENSKEYSTFATQSMIDAVSEWYRKNQLQQSLIFNENENPFEIWQKAANGAGFCELSRLFFASFTERYLKYFLEREASSRITNLFDRVSFNSQLEKHIDSISKHAFETSKISQSFTAGWYNKNTKKGIPTDNSVRGFLSFTFQKLNSELLKEEKGE